MEGAGRGRQGDTSSQLALQASMICTPHEWRGGTPRSMRGVVPSVRSTHSPSKRREEDMHMPKALVHMEAHKNSISTHTHTCSQGGIPQRRPTHQELALSEKERIRVGRGLLPWTHHSEPGSLTKQQWH
jgi:hypothetical protein